MNIMKRFSLVLFILGYTNLLFAQDKVKLPDTGISGVYEVMLGADERNFPLRYFAAFGFTPVDSASIDADKAFEIYGVRSKLTSYRLQNGEIDSHGLLRVLVWDKPLGTGVGYAPPETIGQRMAVMRTENIFRLHDIYSAARDAKQPWLSTEPIADDLFGLDDKKKDFFNRPVIVRENGVYGEFFNHIFFQRFGYHIPGYGTVGEESELRTSEFTHHDFIVKGNIQELNYLQTVLGLKAEKAAEIDGDWLKGPRRVFAFRPGESHWYWGFVSPNNICGKLKFFVPRGNNKDDRSDAQRPGEMGITLHSFYVDNLKMVYESVQDQDNLTSTEIVKNEFGERCFVFSGPLGCTWQIIQKGSISHEPITELKFELVDE